MIQKNKLSCHKNTKFSRQILLAKKTIRRTNKRENEICSSLKAQTIGMIEQSNRKSAIKSVSADVRINK